MNELYPSQCLVNCIFFSLSFFFIQYICLFEIEKCGSCSCLLQKFANLIVGFRVVIFHTQTRVISYADYYSFNNTQVAPAALYRRCVKTMLYEPREQLCY